MPVIKDLITDMDAVHWKKIRRVTPWLLPDGDPPEREYIVPKESMVDVTQTMACIQCGACVSDCLSMEVDPEFIGPAALAKAYRFVGDPRDGQQFERLKDLSEDPHGIYDCTHCFNCIEACPKGVAPMSQIMRLRRIAGADHHIDDRNNGHRHEQAFVTLVRQGGLLHEAELLPRSYGGDSWFGKFHPKAGAELLDSLPVIAKALAAPQGDADGRAEAAQDHRPQEPAPDLRHDRGQATSASSSTSTSSSPTTRCPRQSDEGETETSRARPAPRPPRGARTHEGRLLARLREPRLHPRAARLDGARSRRCSTSSSSSSTAPRCCGAGVIAEHNQELADTLNARTFALAQQVEGADMMMNICSTCQGAQNECQQRLDANAEYRELVNTTLEPEGLHYEKGITNKHFLWLMVEEIGLDAIAQEGQAAAHRPARRALLRVLHRAPDRPRRHHRRAARATRTSPS